MTEDSDFHRIMASGEKAGTLLALLEKVTADNAWQQDAACRDMAPTDPREHDPFFPPKGWPVTPALEVCETCPVLKRCREESRDELFGVWGGRSTETRRAIRNQGAAG